MNRQDIAERINAFLEEDFEVAPEALIEGILALQKKIESDSIARQKYASLLEAPAKA